jgi:hypothetical protein
MRTLPVVVALLYSMVSVAQVNQPARLKLFLDCRINCDENYIRSEINYVDFVSSHTAADVHILINSQVNGSGGNNVVLTFYGQNNFRNQVNTILYVQPPTSTNNELRIQVVKRIRLGLSPFLKKRTDEKTTIPQPDSIKVNGPAIEKDPIDSLEPSPTKDPWNYWVYKLGLDGNYNADENYKSSTLSAYTSANRTTDKLRVNFSMYVNDNHSDYRYENNGTVTNYSVQNNSYGISHFLIKSISGHWSLGYEAGFSRSTFSNNKRRLFLGTGIEYAIFPYKQVNTKFFTISYNLEARHNDYFDTTIYDKVSEMLYSHKLQARLSLNQKWGYVNTGIVYSNYLKDWKLNNLLLSMDINVRVTGGLSFYIYSYGGLVHDQVYLVKGNATLQELLTRRRQLASGYNFYTGIGINYRFGSILNNFVNPRFSNNYD